MKIAFTGGGTGGHIYPNLAVAEFLRYVATEPQLTKSFDYAAMLRDPEFFYLGHPDKLEADLLTSPELCDQHGTAYKQYIEFVPVKSSPLPGKNFLAYPSWTLEFFQAYQAAKECLQANAIDVVFGTGAYVAAPVFLAAKTLKCPYVIHNLDAHIGKTNQIFLRDAEYLTLGFPATTKINKTNSRIKNTGNPVRSSFFKTNSPSVVKQGSSTELKILVTGGSQGAESINELIGLMLPLFKQLSEKIKIRVKHVTGKAPFKNYVMQYLDSNPTKYQDLYFQYEVMPYSNQMDELCLWADMAVCRAGAMTIAEMSASEVVPVFIPLPWAANDHQNKNAKSLVEAKAAFVLDQDLLGARGMEAELTAILNQIISGEIKLDEMAYKVKAFANADAARHISETIMKAAISGRERKAAKQ